MDLDPRIVSLQRGSAAAAREQSRLSAQSRPMDVPRELAMRPDPVLASMGVGPRMRPAANADPTARWMGREHGRGPHGGGAFRGHMESGGWQTDAQVPNTASFARDGASVGLSDATWVDIYLSAGPAENLSSSTSDYRSCNYNDDSNCSLYRLRVNLATGTAREVERVAYSVSGFGVVQPALSPSGHRLAFIWRNSHGTLVSGLLARDLTTSRTSMVTWGDISGASNTRPQFPNWYDNDTLLFHSGKEGENTLYKASISNELWLRFGDPEALLGPASSSSTTTSFADANTRRNDVAGRSTKPTQKKVATFGESTSLGTNVVPRVHGIGPSPTGAADIPTQEFSLGANMAGATINECHHPAWNFSGDRVLCTNQDPREHYPSAAASWSRLLYMYEQGGGTWGNASPAFVPLTPSQLAARFGSSYPNTGTPQCRTYTYKYAEWCASDDYIVATLFCSDDDYNSTNPIFSSRVILIRLYPLEYIDLTRIVERSLGLDRGALHGIYSTCSSGGST